MRHTPERRETLNNKVTSARPRWRTEQATQFYAKSPDRSSGAGSRTEQEIGGIR